MIAYIGKESEKDVCMFLLVTQSCLTLCDPMDCSLPGSSVHGILQARILKWVAISFTRGLPDPGIKPRSPILQADFLPSDPPEKPLYECICVFYILSLPYNQIYLYHLDKSLPVTLVPTVCAPLAPAGYIFSIF